MIILEIIFTQKGWSDERTIKNSYHIVRQYKSYQSSSNQAYQPTPHIKTQGYRFNGV